MKKRIISKLLILALALNVMAPSVAAHNKDPIEKSPIYKVVLPTSYSITVDPYRIINKEIMIESPEYYIINKSSVPIKIDMSFKLTAKEGIALDIKDEKNLVGDNPDNNEIWLAAAFSNDIKEITNHQRLTTPRGDLIYKYIDKEADPLVQTVSGSAIELNQVPHKEADPTVRTVSGSAIELNQVPHKEADPLVQTVSGSAIELNQVPHKKADPLVQTVSGSAIIYTTKNYLNSEPVFYNDTIRAVGRYDVINELDEKSSNVYVINNKLYNKSIILDKANVYTLDDETTVVGETANHNKGVVTFRFIGKVSSKVKWSETDLKLSIIFTINQYDDGEYEPNDDNKGSITLDIGGIDKFNNDIYLSTNKINPIIDHSILSYRKEKSSSDILNVWM